MTGTGRRSRSCRMTPIPSRPGILMSSSTMSGRYSSGLASASSPPFAVTTRNPSSDNAIETSFVILGSSSATSTSGCVLEVLPPRRCGSPHPLIPRWTTGRPGPWIVGPRPSRRPPFLAVTVLRRHCKRPETVSVRPETISKRVRVITERALFITGLTGCGKPGIPADATIFGPGALARSAPRRSSRSDCRPAHSGSNGRSLSAAPDGGVPARLLEPGDVARMTFDEFKHQLPDIDPAETDEWLDSLDQVVEQGGENRARFLMFKLLKRARQLHVGLPPLTQTRNITTISPEQEPFFPGDEELERRIRRLIRWNAVAMVLRANSSYSGIGGHLSTYARSASLYEVGFNWFFRGKDTPGGGDQIFYQGHAAPGMYARAFLEGRFSEDQLDHFRRETVPGEGLSSYPHPRLMPDFWEYPTVSMGIGPISAVYQARFNRYLQNRGLLDTSGSRVWAFLGDGETDEPEALGALHVAAREGLDNLTFVVNCNLQRLDGPVRGNGKIIQELESVFRGSGWNVIKVIWAREWDELLARDVDGALVEKMNNTLDGEFQKYSVAGGAYIREHFFGPDPRLRRLVEHLTDDDLAKLRRGGHDYRKVFAAFKSATDFRGGPTVVLAHTVKGWTLGPGVEARNITHQAKKLSEAELRIFRDRLELPIPDAQLKEAPYYHPGPDSEEVQYLKERRLALGGPLPKRVVRKAPLPPPPPAIDEEFAGGSKTPVSTT